MANLNLYIRNIDLSRSMKVVWPIGPGVTPARKLVVGSTFSILSMEDALGRKVVVFYHVLNVGFSMFFVAYH